MLTSSWRSSTQSGTTLVSIAAILWGLDALLRSTIRIELKPVEIIFWEHLLGFLLLLPFLIFSWKEFFQLRLRDGLMFLLLGLFPGVIATLLYTAALGQVFFSEFSIVVLIQQLQPIWAIIGARLLLREKLTGEFLLLTVVALLGAYLVSFPTGVPNLQSQGNQLYAAVFALLASLIWGLEISFSKIQLRTFSPRFSTGIRFAFGTLCSLIIWGLLAWLAPQTQSPLLAEFTTESIALSLTSNQFWQLLTIVIFTGMGATWVYYNGLKHVSARIVGILQLLWPLTALGVNFFYDIQTGEIGFRPEILTSLQIVGAIILLGAIVTINLRQTRLQSEK